MLITSGILRVKTYTWSVKIVFILQQVNIEPHVQRMKYDNLEFLFFYEGRIVNPVICNQLQMPDLWEDKTNPFKFVPQPL